jgi:hypothetical protein
MRHIGPDVEPDATVALRHASSQTHGIAQKDVVRAGLDEQRGEPGEVGEQRARRPGIRRRHVVVSTTSQRLHRQERIDVGLAVQRRTRERQVHPRGHQAHARRLGQPTRLCSHERHGYQPRSSRFANDPDLPRVDATVEQAAIRGNGIVDAGRVGMLGRQAVVDRVGTRPRAPSDLGGQPNADPRRSERVRAPMQVQDQTIGARPGSLDEDRFDSAECRVARRDVVGQRGRGHHLLDDHSLLGHLAAEIEGRLAQLRVERLALLATHESPSRCNVSAPARSAASLARVATLVNPSDIAISTPL